MPGRKRGSYTRMDEAGKADEGDEGAAEAMIEVLLADDQKLMRDGLSTILGLRDDMTVTGAAADGAEALELAVRLKPQVVLMDIRMPVMDGIESARRIKQALPGTVVLMLTTFEEDDYIIEALAAGAAGFLLKDIPGERLAEAIRQAADGSYMLPSSVAGRLAARLKSAGAAAQGLIGASRARAGRLQLGAKEREVAALLAAGCANKDIAARLFMSEGTVKNYVSGLYAKLGTRDRTVAAIALGEWLAESRE
ncbi:response regulator transcription factor [Paenibacillus pasadenensis]|nr:response regulator transcription factor [Paenibacillus pasadenensis]